MRVDLGKCKKGDKLRLRNGDVAVYQSNDGHCICPHLVKYGGYGVFSYVDDGKWDFTEGRHPFDVIGIIPRKARKRFQGEKQEEKK